jgi:hypothetical protein
MAVDIVDIRIGGIHGVVLETEEKERLKLVVVYTNGIPELMLVRLPKDEA